MQNPVHRFEIDLRDPYEEARRSLTRPRSGGAIGWFLTMAALGLGCLVGWHLLDGQAPEAPAKMVAGTMPTERGAAIDILAIEPGNPLAGDVRGETAIPPAAEPAPGAFSPYDVPVGATTPGPSTKAWPIILHRAGDGAFYADLLLDDRLLTVRVDPAARSSAVLRSDLPASADADAAAWQADTIVLEHLRLPATHFAIAERADGETIIGNDLLYRHFVVDEQIDRLRLAPRATE